MSWPPGLALDAAGDRSSSWPSPSSRHDALVRDRRGHGDGVGPIVAGQVRNIGRIAERHGRHGPRYVADVVRGAAFRSRGRRLELSRLRVEPTSLPSTRRCTALAKVCSSSVHFGKPTRSMLVCSVSASVLLKWRGAAVPMTLRVTLVSSSSPPLRRSCCRSRSSS